MTDNNHKASANRGLRIALSVPEWAPFRDAMEGKPADATYVLQRHLASHLRDKGHRLTFVAPNSLDDFVLTTDHVEDMPVQRTWTASAIFNIASKSAWRLQRLLGIPYLNFFFNYRYMDACLQILPGHDVVYERNGLYNSGLAMASRRLGLPYVIFFEADQIMELDMMGKPVTGLLRRRAKQILQYNFDTAVCIVCVSEEGREHLYTEWKVPLKKMVVFPNAVDVEKFKPDPAARVAIRKSLNLESNPIILFLGNFFHWHDVSTLLDAFSLVLKSHPSARLVLVGDGENRVTMEERASELGLLNAVKFTGIVPHSQAPKYVAAADIAVVPYPPMQQKMWLSPLKLFEYMASGKAVIASAVGQINRVIQDRKNGLLVSPGDSTALAEALAALLEDSDLRFALGVQARQDAESEYSWEHYIARLERLLVAVINRQPFASI